MVVLNLLFYETNGCKSPELSVLIINLWKRETWSVHSCLWNSEMSVLYARNRSRCHCQFNHSSIFPATFPTFLGSVLWSPETVTFEKDQLGQEFITHAGAVRPQDEPSMTKYLLNCCTRRFLNALCNLYSALSLVSNTMVVPAECTHGICQQVLGPEVQVQIQVLQTCTRVQLEYKYKYQVLQVWYVGEFNGSRL